ncbi:MAG: class I SAM-dependent rRNA methyltransferase [Rubrobacter sp.]|nr:class I SAM-dependent rRNA methyltransferase [Rubrobacter sp.]
MNCSATVSFRLRLSPFGASGIKYWIYVADANKVHRLGGKGAYTGLAKRAKGVSEAVVGGRGAKRVRAGHPWVYRSDISEMAGEAGDVVRIVDRGGKFLGMAFANPRSEISLRVASRREEEIGERWFRARIEAAVEYRKSLEIDTSAYRLIHSEADGIPGLVVDKYGEYVVLQIGSAAVEERLGVVVGILEEALSPSGILLRGDIASRRREGLSQEIRVLAGDVPEGVVVREGGVKYMADLRGGQKTGAFLDQRENHLAAGRLSRGRVLDVFSYVGGFALHAAKNADSVEAVDASGPALEAARKNAELDGIENIAFTRANAFDLLRERSDAGEVCDTIILDPPAFAKSKRELAKARKAYKEINLRAMKMLSAGGVLVTCSCSHHLSRGMFEETLRSAAGDAGAAMRVVEWRGQAGDHPEVLAIPETSYLKCAVLRRM